MKVQKATGLVYLLGLVLFVFGCSTTEEKPEKEVKTHYTLKLGKTKEHGNPLPDETIILVDWHSKDGKVKTVDGFRGWDFNEDGRFEMIEVLDQHAKAHTYVYDFDGDGVIDKVVGDGESKIDHKTIFAKAQALLADPTYAH